MSDPIAQNMKISNQQTGYISPVFLPSGTMIIGANYWASHAGLFMWKDWRVDVVKRDFDLLADAGLQLLRVFPLWPDFQPIHVLRAFGGQKAEVRHAEEPLSNDSGMSEIMLDRFAILADLAQERGLELAVALITGWMSGRFFAPPALEALNAVTDPESIKWQIRFVRTFVGRFKNHPAIRAWDLGNECNCMGSADKGQAWLWTASIANAIRTADASRPIISGMHSLAADPRQPWAIRDQGELTDLLTTHPYPLFTPHCNREPLDTMRPLLHAAAETCLYADLSGKPAFVEEFGTLGPMVCGDNAAGGMVRARLFDLWAHDCRAALWWCAHDQNLLTNAPYDWTPIERSLGLLRDDGTAKPALEAFTAFRKTLDSLPFRSLPSRRIDAVCLLTPGQDNWGVAYSTFVLAKQAGFDVRFHFADQDIPEAAIYLLPSLTGHTALPRRIESMLWKRIAAGATLYVSFGKEGYLGEWPSKAGIHIASYGARKGPCEFSLTTSKPATDFSLSTEFRYVVESTDSEILGRETDGRGIYFRSRYEKGFIYSLLAPLESALALEPGAFDEQDHRPWFEIYRSFATKEITRIVSKTSPWLGVTEHPITADRALVVIVNYLSHPIEEKFSLQKPFSILRSWNAPLPVLTSSDIWESKIDGHNAIIWEIGTSQ